MKSYDLVVDLRKCNDSGIGNYIRNCVVGVINKISLSFSVCVLIQSNQNSDLSKLLSEKIVKLNVKSKPFTLLEQIEFFLVVPRSKFFWCTSISIPVFRSGKIISTIYDISYLYLNDSSIKIMLKKAITWLFFRYLVQKTTLFLFISIFSKQEFLKYFPGTVIKKALLKEIPLGVGDEWKNKPSNNALKSPYFIIVGNIRPHKNMRFIIEALSQTNLTEKYHLHIVGDFAGQNLKDSSLINQLGSLSWVSYLGKLGKDSLIEEVRNATVLIAPSLYEGFGLTVLEGMSAGIPVLASEIPAHREVGGNSVQYFNPSSSKDFLDKLDELLKPEVSALLKARGIERAAQFSWSKTIDNTYGEILSVLYK